MPHPDSTAELIDSYTVTTVLTVEIISPQATKTCDVINSLTVYRLPNNQIDYVINAATTQFDQNGDAEAVDGSSTSQIFELVSIAAVRKGVLDTV